MWHRLARTLLSVPALAMTHIASPRGAAPAGAQTRVPVPLVPSVSRGERASRLLPPWRLARRWVRPNSRVEPETEDRDIAAFAQRLRLRSPPPPGETPRREQARTPALLRLPISTPACSLAEADQQTKRGEAVIARGVGYRLSGMRVEMRRHREPSLRTLALEGRVVNPGPSPPFPHKHSHRSGPAPHCSAQAFPPFRTYVPTVPHLRLHRSGTCVSPFRTCVPTVPHQRSHRSGPSPHCSA